MKYHGNDGVEVNGRGEGNTKVEETGKIGEQKWFSMVFCLSEQGVSFLIWWCFSKIPVH
jgi:hypothetical protein